MRIKSVSVKNFLSFGNHMETAKIDRNNLVLLIGKNGAGKSSLGQAITYALFGKTILKVKKHDLINKINNKELLVILEFEQHGNDYKVIRGMKPNIFEIYRNGELVNQSSSVLDYQYILETEIIGYNFELFRQLIMLSPISFVSFFEMGAYQRRAILEELLSLREISEMLSVLQGRISENKSLMTESSATLRELTNTVRTLNESLTTALNNAKEGSKKKKDEIQTLLSSVEGDREKERKISERLSEIDKETRTEQRRLLEEAQTKITSALGQLTYAANKMVTDSDFLHSNDICPSCQQSIETSHKEKLLESLSVRKLKASDGKAQLEEKLETVKNELIEHKEILKEYQNLENALKITRSNIQANLDKIKWLETESPVVDTSHLNEGIKHAASRLKETQSVVEELESQRDLLVTAKDFLSDDGIRKMIIKKYIPFITQRINWWLKELDFFAKVTISDEFEESIKVRGFDPTSYHNLSSGERSKLTLATVFAFRELLSLRNNSDLPFLWIDEILENIDVEGKTKLLWNLREIVEKNKISIYVVSHGLGGNVDPFHESIEMYKEGNFSKYRETLL